MSEILPEEQAYLDETLCFLKKELEEKYGSLKNHRRELIDFNKEMFREAANNSLDQDKNYEMVQYLTQLHTLAQSADAVDNQVRKYEKMLGSPYFGRFDFKENDSGFVEKMYIGYFNLMQQNGKRIYVMDWRAPMSALYYRFEPGPADFSTDYGKTEGELLLKRQIKIEQGVLKYHFDTNVVINDSILCGVLSNNATGKMKTIVETIQKEQDRVIRDMGHNVIAVTGVAGSGKTNIALHRIAYLLYEGRKKGIGKNNILIISPNSVFAEYVDEVLPTLGEEAVAQATMYSIVRYALRGTKIQSKNGYYEQLMANRERRDIIGEISVFKSSEYYCSVLEAYAEHYMRKCHDFEDVYFNKELIISSVELKALFLDSKLNLSAESSLNRLNTKVLEKINENTPKLHKKIRELVENNPKMRFEEEKNVKRLADEIIAGIKSKIKKQFVIDVFRMYHELVSDKELFKRLAGDMKIPDYTCRVLDASARNLEKGFVSFDDACAMMYLKLILSANKEFGHIKHVVIDEAQDYGPLHFKCFARLYPQAKLTVLGDANQTIDKSKTVVLEEVLGSAYPKKNIASFRLTKCYRSAYEITEYANRILGLPSESAFERHERLPEELKANGKDRVKIIDEKAGEYLREGYGSVAVITGNAARAKKIYETTSLDKSKITYFGSKNPTLLLTGGNVCILPVYMAKGLEFDAVIVDGEDFFGEDMFSKKLKYTACTRALHRLCILE